MGKGCQKILIANRGEIAVRIMRTCRAMGIETIAVYSEADRDAPHVMGADQAVCIGGAEARESYLDVASVLEAAERTGADAVHPGYGFLSENAAFAQAVSDAGLTWIGPSPEVIEAMGDKVNARRMMADAGVPIVPGVELTEDATEANEAIGNLGYPVLVKASAGGGGKGMRAVQTPDGLADALEGAAREAVSAFGNGTVYVEKLLEHPRHVEIQIFGDTSGRVVHLAERECSIQRRHQKIVEEAPCPRLAAPLRKAMGQAAIRAASALSYVGAGTVEFMVDAEGGFYFLEMNTRLQVEHPVTELIMGVDLVAAQIQVARGEPLPWTQDELVPRGHAIEVRLYAEDPAANFLPSVGRLERYRAPDGPGLRHDGGVSEGGVVSPHYDPMLAKLIASGATRTEAIGRMRAALAEWEVHGVHTNISLLQDVMAHPAFVEGEVHTGFLEEHLPSERRCSDEASEWHWIALAIDEALGAQTTPGRRAGAGPPEPIGPWLSLGAWTIEGGDG